MVYLVDYKQINQRQQTESPLTGDSIDFQFRIQNSKFFLSIFCFQCSQEVGNGKHHKMQHFKDKNNYKTVILLGEQLHAYTYAIVHRLTPYINSTCGCQIIGYK